MQRNQQKQKPSNEELAYRREVAWLCVNFGYTVEEAQALDMVWVKYLHEAWIEKLKIQERMSARICATIATFAAAFGGSRERFFEEKFMAIGKNDKSAELTPEQSRAFMLSLNRKDLKKSA